MIAPAPIPIRCQARGGVFTMVLDTPGSAVNILDEAAASGLRGGLRAALDAGAERVVLRSGKPGSFLNGASLLLTSVSSTPEHVRRASEPLRRAYADLAACPIPTVAVIEGSCFGCGFELILCCAYRVALDAHPVQFYMTELVDYRLLPIFGGTQRLPRLLGEGPAARLLLDGERWGAEEALGAGLLDAIFPPEHFATGVASFVARPRRARAGRRRREPAAQKRRVPPPRRGLYEECSALIHSASHRSLASGLEAELEASVRTVCAPEARRAVAWFFVRQMALAASWGSAEPRPPDVRLRCDADPGLARLDALLRDRFRGHGGDVVLLGSMRRRGLGARAQVGFRRLAGRGAGRGLVYFPDHALDTGYCELAIPRGAVPAGITQVARALRWAGIEAIATRPKRELVTNRLLARYALELGRMLDRGVSAAAIVAEMWREGFARMPTEVLGPLVGPRVGRRLESLRRAFRVPRRQWGSAQRASLAPLYAGLVAEVAACVGDGSLAHLAQGDFLVQGLLDFPREQGSLLLAADRVGVASLLAEARGAGWAGVAPPLLAARARRGVGLYSLTAGGHRGP